MDHQEKVLDRIQIWANSISKKRYVRSFDRVDVESHNNLIVVLVVLDSGKEVTLLHDQLSDHLRSLTDDLRVYRVDLHSHASIQLSADSYKAEIVLGCIPQSQVPKDDDLSHFLYAPQTGLKPSRDGQLLRQLQLPRLWAWFDRLLSSESDPSFIDSLRVALKFLVEWSTSRRIFGDGFFTPETLIVMICSLLPTRSSTPFELIQKFFRKYSSEFVFNESSVSAHVCGLTGSQQDGYYGSMINEEEGIDSDVDDELRSMRLARKVPETEPDESGETHSRLATNANENDDVHPHKRLRYELGQIRDIRRFYAVENTRIEKVSCRSSDSKFKNFLDYLDVFTVCHPSPGYDLSEGDHINLALRTLESHKKLMLQELTRANFILSDCVGDDFETVAEILCREKNDDEIQIFCSFKIESDVPEILHTMHSIVHEQVWFLVQELQAIHGLMVVPIQGKNFEVSVGLIFVKDEPYCATDNTEIDLLGPMSRVMLRCKKIIKERSDYEEKFAGKFIVRSRVVRNS